MTLEAILGFIVIFVFFVGTINLFFWFNRNIVERQSVFQRTRTRLGGGNLNGGGPGTADASIHFYTEGYEYQQAHVFPEER
ncbi:hypothetical protein ACFL1I_07835 [Candidatus Omnitrophota bacterium]